MPMKIPEDTLKEICKKFENGQNCTSLGKEYNINRKLIAYELKLLGYKIQRGYTKEILDQAKKLYKQGNSISVIATKLHIDRHQLSENLHRLKIRETLNPKNGIGKFIENDETNYIKTEYLAGKSISQLAKEIGRSTNFIYRIINHYGICKTERLNRKHIFDESIFEKVDTEEKAYFLGLLMADGCVYFSKTSMYSVELCLQEEDKATVQAFANFFKATPPIPVEHIKAQFHYSPTFRANVFSKKLCKDLIHLGCVQRKSLVLKFPTWIEDTPELLPHFMRGYFDGDGCIYIPKKKTPQPAFSIVGTYDFCKHFNEMLVKYAHVNSTKIDQNNNLFRNTHAGKNQVQKIFEFLYKDATIYMERKYQIFISFYNHNAV